MNFDNLEAGIKTDILIAENVMGWKVEEDHVFLGGYYFSKEAGKKYAISIFRPSTDLVTAMEVAEKMPPPFSLRRSYERKWGEGPLGWRVNWCNTEHCPCHEGEGCPQGNDVWAETAPLAICRGALKKIKPVPRCKRCGWPLEDSVEKGCIEGNCSMRPLPEKPFKVETLPKGIGGAVKAERERIARILVEDNICPPQHKDNCPKLEQEIRKYCVFCWPKYLKTRRTKL